MTPDKLLEHIFEADRSAEAAEATLLQTPPVQLVELICQATASALSLDEPLERTRQLRRLADLSAQIPGPEMIENLVAILDSEDATSRLNAGEALLDLAYERYAEFARTVKRLVEQAHQGPSMSELPFIVAEVAEPSAVSLISAFLQLNDADAVAAAIEALVVVGDPSAQSLLKPLLNDSRTVTLHDEQETLTVSLADLAAEAMGALSTQSST